MSDSRVPTPLERSDSADGVVSGNGRSQYDQAVSRKPPPTKAEIEARLQFASDSITSRVQAIQDEFNLTTEAVRSFLQSPMVGVLAVLGAGMLVGRLLGGSRRTKARAGDPDAFAAILIREVEEALANGESPEDAVHRVVDSLGVLSDSGSVGSSGSTLKWIAGLALRSVLSQGIRNVTQGRQDDFDATADSDTSS